MSQRQCVCTSITIRISSCSQHNLFPVRVPLFHWGVIPSATFPQGPLPLQQPQPSHRRVGPTPCGGCETNKPLMGQVNFFFFFFFLLCCPNENFSHGKFGSLSPRKAGCNRVALPNLNQVLVCIVHAVLLCVTIPLIVRPTLLRQIDTGSLTCVHIWMSAVHTKGGQAQTKHQHKSWLEGTETNCPTLCTAKGIEPRVFGFEFPTLYNRWATYTFQVPMGVFVKPLLGQVVNSTTPFHHPWHRGRRNELSRSAAHYSSEQRLSGTIWVRRLLELALAANAFTSALGRSPPRDCPPSIGNQPMIVFYPAFKWTIVWMTNTTATDGCVETKRRYRIHYLYL